MEIQNKSNWLTGHDDNLADIFTISQCMCLCDIGGDGDNCLVLADLTDHKSHNKQMKLKVYRGISMIKDTSIIDLPTGVISFFLDNNEPRTPGIAVASGPYIYVYKNMKPYFKFTLPLISVNEVEENAWKNFSNGDITYLMLKEQLDCLRNEGVSMSVRSNKMLVLSEDKLEAFCQSYRGHPIKNQTVATCMTTLFKSHSEKDSISCLVVGTEAGQLLIIDPEAFTVLFCLDLESTPVFVCSNGLYDVEFRVYVACRNGCIYVARRGNKTSRRLIQLTTQPIGMIRINKNLIIGCMDDSLRCFSPKGRQIWLKKLPASLVSMCLLESRQHNILGVIVSLNNGLVQIYKDRDLVETITAPDSVTGMLFGQFGREQASLLMITRSGSLIIKLLKRTADFSISDSAKGPPQAQFEKLNIPKKTQLFIDQTFRERENAVAVHRKFMEDLSQLRLITARNYVEVLETKHNPISSVKSNAVMLSIEVQGIGPTFKMKVILQNTNLENACTDLVILFVYDIKIYSIEEAVIEVPYLVPGVSYPFSVFVECLSDKGVADTIKVLVLKNNESEPLVIGMVNMPVSETFLAS